MEGGGCEVEGRVEGGWCEVEGGGCGVEVGGMKQVVYV